MTARYLLQSIAALIAASLLANALRAEQPLTFERDVRPILRAHCFQCHGEEDEQKDRTIVPIVRHVGKVPECASEKSEAQHTQANALDVALGLIGD